ncbi:MAG TPA: class I poly(R)-hydroxyalkanoic acid synthase, partial [Sphingobium sp.]
MKAQDLGEPHLPTLEQMQQWTQVLGQAQQLMLEQAAGATGRALPFDPEAVSHIQTSFANEGLALWQRFLNSGGL